MMHIAVTLASCSKVKRGNRKPGGSNDKSARIAIEYGDLSEFLGFVNLFGVQPNFNWTKGALHFLSAQ